MPYPLALKSTLVIKVWGGRRLADVLGKSLPTDEPYGESWEVHDSAMVVNGTYAGKTLGEVLEELGTDLIGTHNDPSEGFPLLAKFLDAQDWLSVQVHPDDKQARELENQPRGKTEAWVLMDTAPDAKLVIGVTPGTSRETMAEAIRTNTLEPLLAYADVNAGDVLYMPAGTVHAIGPGCLIYEIQQSSNTTYRLYDWGRMGLDGNPRELHIDKGVQVSNVDDLPEVTHPTDDSQPIVDGAFFQTYRHSLDDDMITLDTGGNLFHALSCIDGQCSVSGGEQTVNFSKGQSVLIPANLGNYTLSGDGVVLRSLQKMVDVR